MSSVRCEKCRFVDWRLICNILFLIALLQLCACATLPEKIQKSIHQNDFATALTLLEEKGVGEVLDPDADEEALSARLIYEDGVFNYYKSKADSEIALGNLRQAHQYSLEGKAFCAWSDSILNIVRIYSERVQRLNEIQNKWRHLDTSSKIPLDEAHSISAEIRPEYDVINDSPFLVSLYRKATKRIMLDWSVKLASYGKQLSRSDLSEFSSALEAFPNLSSERTAVVDAFINYTVLPKTKKDDRINRSGDELKGLVKFFRNADDYPLLADCVVVLKDLFADWTLSTFIPSLKKKDVSFQLLDVGEELLASVSFVDTNELKEGVATAHLMRARIKASDGKGAAISLLHIQRYKNLNGGELDKQSRRVLQKSEASLNSSSPITASISIGGDPHISPTLYDMVRNSLASRIGANTQSYFKWLWRNPDTAKSDVEVYLDEVTAYFPSKHDLSVVSSKYLSHYQNVPNPQKDRLASQLNYADSAVDSAKWTYDSAVTSHNFNPTQLSLNYVNSTYSNYAMAVDRYNSILRQYQSTPATVSEAVYLPYSFEQGTIRSGWKISVTIKGGETTERYTRDIVDTDFVKFGTKANDINSSNRRDDGIDIDTSNEKMISKLDLMLDDIVSTFKQVVSQTSVEGFPRAEPEERVLLSAMYQPFGPQIPTGAQKWVREAFATFDLPATNAKPVRLALRRNGTIPSVSNVKRFVDHGEGLVCEIKHEFGHGTGTLISRDGLILTCAHVLTGSSFKAIFHSGPNKGTYQCETVFVDELNDVALIQASGLRSTRWANLRLRGGATKGESILAIGNPSLDGSATVTAGATKGIVANPNIAVYGTQRMVGDLTVASGSSGGPIFSLETGELVGVVTAVWSAGFNKESGVASSGYFCLGAPTEALPDWLGLHY